MEKHCVLHPDRKAKRDAQGILVCVECWERYNVERRGSNGGPITQRPFLQSLVRLRHGLNERIAA